MNQKEPVQFTAFTPHKAKALFCRERYLFMIEILYEDKDVAVCVKPVGVLSQCDGEKDMVALLKEQLGGEVFPVHRLDRNVGGVMVFARQAKAAASLSAQIQQGSFVKRYFAAVQGVPSPEAGEMTDLLFKDSRSGKTFVVDRPRKGVKEARLAYRTLDSAEGKSLVLVRLFTGRTHQIRAQFASRRMSLLGDGKYGSRDKKCDIALWSHRVSFTHPASGEPMDFAVFPDLHQYPWNLFDSEKLEAFI